MATTRRDLIQAGGIGLLSFYVGGCEREMTPRAAKQAGAELRVLTAAESGLVTRLGEVLLPGSGDAGLAHYLDHQLAAAPAEQMLMIKYLGVNPPFLPFYRTGLSALEAAAQQAAAQSFAEMQDADANALVGEIAAGSIADWQGPPAAFFYFVLRNDACDVLYGTQEGFEQLGVPYMAHVEPPSRWGE